MDPNLPATLAVALVGLVLVAWIVAWIVLPFVIAGMSQDSAPSAACSKRSPAIAPRPSWTAALSLATGR
jgi:hypothetical protein